MLASTKMIKHFFSQKKGNMSVEQQEMKHFMVQCPNFILQNICSAAQSIVVQQTTFSVYEKGKLSVAASRGGACPPYFKTKLKSQKKV